MKYPVDVGGRGRLARLALCAALAFLPGVAPLRADPFADAMAAYRAGDPGLAAGLFHKLARDGDGLAQFNIALLYRVGQGRPRNDREALYWAWRARLSGVAQARALIGFVSPDVPLDQRRALVPRLLADLAPGMDAGTPAAVLGASAIYMELADPADPAEAYYWQSMAATLGVPGAGALRDKTAALIPEADRAGLQDRVMARFQAWCKANPHPPEACGAGSS